MHSYIFTAYADLVSLHFSNLTVGNESFLERTCLLLKRQRRIVGT